MLSTNAPVDWDPLTAFDPLQPPAALQVLALDATHVKVALPPLGTVLGAAEKAIVGVGAVTDTVAVCDADPPGPVQVKP